MKLFGLEITRGGKPAMPVARRDFNAAKIGNLTSDWTTALVDLNSDIQGNLSKIRARTRDRAKNSCWFRRYVEVSQSNIIGTNGLRLNMRAKNPDGKNDAYANTTIEAAWAEWGRKVFCTPSGGMSWHDVQLFAVQSLKVDGEFFFKKVRGSVNKFGFSIAPIDAALCDVNYNATLQNGNRVVNGVELDSFLRPVAYYFQSHLDYLSGMWSTAGANLQRVPASEIIHGFRTEGAGQVRGFPDGVAALLPLHMLDKYSEAEVTAARLAACKMGYYEQDSPDAAATLGDSKDGKDLVSEAEPGLWQLLPPGVKAKESNPTHPTANHAMFVKTQLREIASGWRLAYNNFANDLEGVNYSSIRQGVLEERSNWELQQNWMVDHLCRPVFESWLEMYLLTGLSSLPMAKYDKFSSPNWLPRRWQWIDPLKDAEANKLMRTQGWKSDSQIVGEQGNDLDEIQEQILADEEARFAISVQSDELNVGRIAAVTDKIDASGVPALHWSHIITIGGATSAPGAYLEAASGATTAADTVDSQANSEGE